MEVCNFEIAVKLKEKGYPQRYYGKYSMTGACYFNDGRFYKDGCIANVEDCCTAPTISQVLKWLREVKRIDAGAVWDNRDGKWVGYINEMDMPDLVGEYVLPNTHDTYEAATIASIEYVLDNLI